MPDLFARLWALSGKTQGSAVRFYVKHENIKRESKSIFGVKDWWELQRPVVRDFPKEVLDFFPLVTKQGPKEALEFLKSRGVKSKIAFQCGVRFFEGTNFLAFPLTDTRGELKVVRVRSIYEKELKTVNGKMVGKKELQFPRIKDLGCWFGLHLVDWSRPVMLVEGELDALRLKTLGYTNAVASTGWHIQESQAAQIVSPQVIVGLDSDKAGIKGAFRAEKLFRGKTNLVFADWGIVGCKDAGELRGRKSLRKVLSNLKRSPKYLKEIDKRTTV